MSSDLISSFRIYANFIHHNLKICNLFISHLITWPLQCIIINIKLNKLIINDLNFHPCSNLFLTLAHFLGGRRGQGIKSAALIMLLVVLSNSSSVRKSVVPYAELLVVNDFAYRALICSSIEAIFSSFVVAIFLPDSINEAQNRFVLSGHELTSFPMRTTRQESPVRVPAVLACELVVDVRAPVPVLGNNGEVVLATSHHFGLLLFCHNFKLY
jgi:hypothetical protein